MATTEVQEIVEVLTEFNTRQIEMTDRMERLMLATLSAIKGLAKNIEEYTKGKPILNPDDFDGRLNRKQ